MTPAEFDAEVRRILTRALELEKNIKRVYPRVCLDDFPVLALDEGDQSVDVKWPDSTDSWGDFEPGFSCSVEDLESFSDENLEAKIQEERDAEERRRQIHLQVEAEAKARHEAEAADRTRRERLKIYREVKAELEKTGDL